MRGPSHGSYCMGRNMAPVVLLLARFPAFEQALNPAQRLQVAIGQGLSFTLFQPLGQDIGKRVDRNSYCHGLIVGEFDATDRNFGLVLHPDSLELHPQRKSCLLESNWRRLNQAILNPSPLGNHLLLAPQREQRFAASLYTAFPFTRHRCVLTNLRLEVV